MLTLHGPHHVAQNSTTYTLPLSNLATLSPLIQCSMSMGGAASPIVRVLACDLASGLAGWGLASCAMAAAAIVVASAALMMVKVLGILGISCKAGGEECRSRGTRSMTPNAVTWHPAGKAQ